LTSSSRSRLLAELNDLSLKYERLSEEARVLAFERDAVKRRLQSLRASLRCAEEPSFALHGACPIPRENVSSSGRVGRRRQTSTFLGRARRLFRDGPARES
jgi:hypothetical protein